MRYDEFPPPQHLSHAIRCLWHLEVEDSDPSPDRVVPDGCAEIIINRADAFQRRDGLNPWARQAPLLFVGQLKRSIMLLPGAKVDLIGIRFQPTGAYALLGLPMHELTDLDVDLRSLAPRLADDLIDAVRSESPGQRHHQISAALLREQERRSWRPRTASAVPAILQAFDQGQLHAGRAAAGVDRSRRAVERDFRAQVGLSPKSYQRISRMQRLLADLEKPGLSTSLALLALRHGFVDQPHLNREFRLLVGLSPKAWLHERSALAQIFLNPGESHYSKASTESLDMIEPSID